jgi:predicted metal-binding membrane protein
MGAKEGSFCAAGRWALVALMFVTGVMSVLWMGIILGGWGLYLILTAL